MIGLSGLLTLATFASTMMLIYWRPRGMNEAIPATIGAIIVVLIGGVSLGETLVIGSKISEAAITIISTMVMALTMESIGFFSWVALKLLNIAKGSGVKLFWLTNLLCFLMTLFLNNDGSILITTPVILLILKRIAIPNKQKLAYLISGALIATASSVPIGVSNIVNLISLKIVGITLLEHTQMIFVPGVLGLLVLSILLFLVFRRVIPKKIAYFSNSALYSQLSPLHSVEENSFNKNRKWMGFVLVYVLIARILLFVASYLSIPMSLVAVTTSTILIAWRWYFLKINPKDILKKAPWHIFVFAFAMYVIVYGLQSVGLTEIFVKFAETYAQHSVLNATLVMGMITSITSNIFNNHPGLMLSTLTITQMDVSSFTLKMMYLANIIGSDMGALLLPTGTLATLIWFHILKENNVQLTWRKYLKVTFIVIPATLIITLLLVYFWVMFVFH